MDQIIRVSGSPFEQGVTQGHKLKDEIAANIRGVYEDLAKVHYDEKRYRRFVQANHEFLGNQYPEQEEEMRGISEGSGIPLEDILILNIPAYFMARHFVQDCSMVLARGKSTLDGKTYLIKNRDMRTPITQCVVERHYSNGTSLVEVNGTGTVTYPAAGMNSFGLAAATSGFWSPKATTVLEDVHSASIFINIHHLLRDCKTVNEVLEYLKTYPRVNGLNLLVADLKDAVAIETTRDSYYVEQDSGTGLLYRTNHYVLDEIKCLNPDVTPTTTTYARRKRIEEILKANYGRIRFQDMWRIMSDHADGDLGICRHMPGDAPGGTVCTSLVVLEDREIFTSLIQPCLALRYAKL